MGNKAKALVVVKVFRRFEYPKAMLHKFNFMQDALVKARDDMQIIINEVMNQDHHELDINMFELEAIEERGYKFRNSELEGNNFAVEVVNIGKAAKALSTQDIELKYGQLNHELNPQLYEREPELRNVQGELLREEVWYMRQDIEDEMYNLYENYRQRLRAAQKI